MASNSRRLRSDDGSNRWTSQVKAPPQFFKIIHSSAVPYQKLRIPNKFLSQYGKNLGSQVFLKVPNGAVWKVELVKSNDGVWMCNGWKEFAKYYSIGYGHLLVFRYDGSYNFHVIIFDTSASEIEYPVSTTHGEQTNANGNGNSKILETEDIEIDDSVETLGDVPSAKYNTRKEEIHGRVDIGTCLKTRKASYYRANIDKDISVQILDDSLVPEFSVSDQERANKKSRMEINSSMPKFLPDIQPKGRKLPNQKKNGKIEIATEEYPGGASIEHRRFRSQMPVEMTSATANVNSTALERAQKFKSRKPFFVVQIPPTSVSHKFGLNLPRKFVRKYLRENHQNISLQFSDGMTWLMSAIEETNILANTIVKEPIDVDASMVEPEGNASLSPVEAEMDADNFDFSVDEHATSPVAPSQRGLESLVLHMHVVVAAVLWLLEPLLLNLCYCDVFLGSLSSFRNSELEFCESLKLSKTFDSSKVADTSFGRYKCLLVTAAASAPAAASVTVVILGFVLAVSLPSWLATF
ncbi:hypothetical protein Vadar_001860 [Vaccinium darrowii]|uniref:Uncharacterized protein n=1 Tax=Vaccinium darrowii TaxID=229202 RepID=A0ACB7YC44_9ERIC|nr:hypothetical protein Vadar_001860 [Vaccinium darrowii]